MMARHELRQGAAEMSRSFARRIRRIGETHGLVGLFRHAFYRMAEIVISPRHAIYRLNCPLELRSDSRLELQIDEFSKSNPAPDSWISFFSCSLGQDLSQECDDEFRNNGILWIATLDNAPVAYQWHRWGKDIKRWFVPLAPNDGVIFNTFTVPQFRGRGIAARMQCHISKHVRTFGGQVFIDVSIWNKPSIRAIEKSGFARIAVMRPLPKPGHSKPSSPYATRGLGVRTAYLGIAICAWMWSKIHSQQARDVVLCYHSVTAAQRAGFARQMRKIGERAVEAAQRYLPGRDSTPLPTVCVTFDDAFANLIDNALPVTTELGIPVTIFAPTSNLGQTPTWPMRPGHPEASERIMTAEEIRRVHRPGLVDFGSHTATHANLAQLSGPELSRELTGSRQALADILGEPPRDLALPYGAFNAEVLAAARAAGFSCIFTLEERTDGVDDRGACGRFLMSPDAWPIEFHLTCAGAYGWLYGWRSFWRARRRQREDLPSPIPSL